MSFLGGSDCGPGNPLQSLLKHNERDTSVLHDRWMQQPGPSSVGGGAGAGMHGMRIQQQPGLGGGQQVVMDREMQNFYAARPNAGGQGGDAFAMEHHKNVRIHAQYPSRAELGCTITTAILFTLPATSSIGAAFLRRLTY